MQVPAKVCPVPGAVEKKVSGPPCVWPHAAQTCSQGEIREQNQFPPAQATPGHHNPKRTQNRTAGAILLWVLHCGFGPHRPSGMFSKSACALVHIDDVIYNGTSDAIWASEVASIRMKQIHAGLQPDRMAARPCRRVLQSLQQHAGIHRREASTAPAPWHHVSDLFCHHSR